MNELYFILGSISFLVLCLILIAEWNLERKIKEKDKFQFELYKIKRRKQIIKDFSFPVEKNFWGGHRKTNIDYLILTDRNLFCVKYVQYEGFVYGNEVTKIWWNVANEKEKFLNPMEIVYMQSKLLKRKINSEIKIVPIVVFLDNCNLDYVKKSSEDILLLKKNDFLKYINRVSNSKKLRRKSIKELEEQLVDLSTLKNSNTNDLC